MRERIAVIGTGISGLGAAWALAPDHDVVVYEASNRVGGHSNTVDVWMGGRPIPVDTGFIVYNEINYPNLTRLFATLGVTSEPSDMSFSLSELGGLEYGASLKGVLADPSNLMRSRFRRMLGDINRFRRFGATLTARPGEGIESFLRRHGFSPGFMDDYLFPMAGAIWSARSEQVRKFPAASIMRFLANHGLIEIVGRPRWRTVSGGSRNYVSRLIASFEDRIRLNSPVESIRQDGRQLEVISKHGKADFDHVVIATHSDQALQILGNGATPEERRLLGAIEYESNVAVLHSDRSLMPRRRPVWSSWNSMRRPESDGSSRASLTYWMNRLQNIESPSPLFVTLNPVEAPDQALVHAEFRYAHPQFNAAAVEAQAGIAAIQGTRKVWFAGAYLGYGFHEDGLQSGLNVAAALGSPAPWQGTFTPMSSARAFARSGVHA